MSASSKVLIFLFGATVISFGVLIYKGYRVVPLIKMNQYKTDRGTVGTGLKFELYNPIKDKDAMQN